MLIIYIVSIRLNAELFKADAVTTASILQPLFNTIWDRRKIPDDWNPGIIIKIPKKGALSECNNWCGIVLLSTPSKILAKVIMKRLSLAVDLELREEQAGFRRGRGCIDHIFTLRNIIEQSTKWQRTLYVNFVHFAKAFDSKAVVAAPREKAISKKVCTRVQMHQWPN